MRWRTIVHEGDPIRDNSVHRVNSNNSVVPRPANSNNSVRDVNNNSNARTGPFKVIPRPIATALRLTILTAVTLPRPLDVVTALRLAILITAHLSVSPLSRSEVPPANNSKVNNVSDFLATVKEDPPAKRE